MATFTTDELVSSTKLVKNFWRYSQKLRDGSLNKIGILKNNEVWLTIIPSDVYDFFEDLIENIEIYKQVSTRKDKKDFVDAEVILNKFNLSLKSEK